MANSLPAGVKFGAGGFLGCAALVGTVLVVQAQSPSTPAGVVRENVSLAGVPVGGKSADELRKVADDLSARLLGYPVTVRYGRRRESTTPAKLGGKADPKAAVEAVLALSSEQPGFFDRIRETFTGKEAKDIPLPVQLSEEGVRKGLLRFSVRIGEEPKEARLTKVNGQFRSSEPRPGKELDSAAITRALQAALDAADLRSRVAASLETDRRKWLAAQAALDLPAATREAQPRITLEQLRPITATLATFSTPLAGTRNRVHNISLACKAIDGTVLLPGDVFSYNETVGPRVPSAGFREAPVIIRGELQKGTGGGICQVSSTLYNAILLADLSIVRRSHHAFPVHYVPAGRDATVVDGAIDFKFKNPLEHPIAIDAKVSRGRVLISVYGHPDDRRQVEIVRSGISRLEPSVRTVSDPRLPRGRRVVEKKAQGGQRVTVTRVVKKDGQVLRREVVSRDYYRPFAGIVRVGTGSAPRPAGSGSSPSRV
ncbi:MAG TPA: VanW family protein, partial [Armatimonadota bacterium]|nr:VanW family protein [Armatimonadota bacterium]